MIKKLIGRLGYSREWIIVVALALLVALLRAPSLEQPFDNDSGAIAYHARQIVRGDPLYGTHHSNHHMPATYYLYALAFSLFGDSLWSVKFFLLLWTIVTVYLLYRLGLLMTGHKIAGALAAGVYALLSSHVHLLGHTAEIELFANLPRIAGVLVLLRLIARRAAAWKFMFVGMLGSAAFLFKAVYVSPWALAGVVLFVEFWLARSKRAVWRETVVRGLWVAGGAVIGLLPVVIYFGLVGLLPRFLAVFTLGRGYVSFRTAASPGPEYMFLFPFVGLSENNVALVIFSITGSVMAAANLLLGRYKQYRQCLTEFYVVAWYAISFLEAGITRTYFSHYYLLVLPPLVLLAAWFLLRLYRVGKSRSRVTRFAVLAFLMLSVVLVLSFSVVLNYNYYYCYLAYKFGPDTWHDFVLKGAIGGKGLIRVQELADYVAARTSPSDYIYYWSGDTQIYYLADRRCAIDVLWPIYADATGPYQRIFSPRTKYVILGESNNIPRADWLYTELEGKYALETVIDEQEVYRRID
ncbi:MAG: glycosyltransferase family 39 protein [Anaerolineae bacterium]|nr:glycosyltransferase family 39 protein [Anaerolineae bacterium]